MVCLKFLGGATIEGDGGVLGGAVARRHPLALLALLAPSSPPTASRSKLVGLLWPDVAEAVARRRLNACLHRVRRELGHEAVSSVGDDLRLNEDVLRCDVREFERAVADGDHEHAIDLYGGPFLDGFSIGSASFEHWVDGERDRLRADYWGALEALAHAAEAHGDGDVAATWWRTRLAEDPFDSRVTRRLMEALVSAGNTVAALRAAREHAELLERELGVLPPAELRELVERLGRSSSPKEATGQPYPRPGVTPTAAGVLNPKAPSSVAPRTDGRGAEGSRADVGAVAEPLAFLDGRRAALAVVALFLVGAASWRFMAADDGGTAPIVYERSVAVLPFDNASPAAEHAFFAEALTEEVTSALTEVPELLVKSRSSASQFAGSGMTLADFARTLGVSHVIEGSVQRSDHRARISVQLIDARTDRHVWAKTYERELADLFGVQVEVAQDVAERLAASFSEREQERILAGATQDALAYDLYLRARDEVGPSLDERIELLEEAVRRDSTFWPAWERLAFAYLGREQRGEGSRWGYSSRAALQRAMKHADSSHVLRLRAREAMIFGGDEDETIARLRAAVEGRPGDLLLTAALGRLYTIRGRLPEAARLLRNAALRDPLEADRWQALFPLYWWAGLYQQAGESLHRAVEVDPGDPGPWVQFGWQWMIQNRFDLALAASDSAIARGHPHASLHKGFLHWWAGQVDEAATIFSAFDPDSVPTIQAHLPMPMAHVLFTAGDSTRARQIVERFRAMLESQAVEPFDPEWRVFPRLQLAALDRDPQRALELFRIYVERGGRDPTWYFQSPLFAELVDDPEFRGVLDALTLRVEHMRRQMERDLRRAGAGSPR